MNRPLTVLLLITLLALLLAWAPWLTRQRAERLVEETFVAAWQGIIDGCGLECEGCGVKTSRRLPTGYSVEIEYACGMIPFDSPEFHQTSTAYVSPLGTVHGLDTP